MKKLTIILKGGPGSGHHGHVGRPGKRGGSLPGRGGAPISAGGIDAIQKVMDDLELRPANEAATMYRGNSAYNGIHNTALTKVLTGSGWEDKGVKSSGAATRKYKRLFENGDVRLYVKPGNKGNIYVFATSNDEVIGDLEGLMQWSE